ncbi:MAG: hypothetical protein AAF216_13060 [Pseudomonadota bacterium]
MILKILKYVGLTALFGVIFLVVSNCTMLGLNYSSLETDNKAMPSPAIEATTMAQWQDQRPALLAEFEQVIYGPYPADLETNVLARRVVDEEFAGGRAVLSELQIQIGGSDFYLGLAVPKDANANNLHGVVIGQTFSDNCGVFQHLGMTQASGNPCEGTDIPWIARYIFGEFIAEVDFDAFFDAGFAYASYYASDVVPDSSTNAQSVMADMGTGATAPTSTLMAWAAAYGAAIDAMDGADWLNNDQIAVYGHSRHGKSALLAGAWDRRIDAVISHQSGFGGAALSSSSTGERIDRVAESYPHWFAPGFAELAQTPDQIPLDQHQLIALNAPTPVFLGNGRRDVWSDPNSTFRAAAAASSVYGLYGVSGLEADTMVDFRPGDGLAYFVRPGGHGVDQRDVDGFIAFLTAQFGATGTATSPLAEGE